MRSDYATNRYKKISKTPHVILTGYITVKSCKTFFEEYFQEDHGSHT